MTPGECLYLLGGTWLDRLHHVVDLFQLLPPDHASLNTKYLLKKYFSIPSIPFLSFPFFLTPKRFGVDSKAMPWHQLFEQADTSSAPGAVILQRMKRFRDDVLHPHILSLYQTTNSYQAFVEGIKQPRFMIPDLEYCQKLFEEWKSKENERKEKKRQFYAERDEAVKKAREDKEAREMQKKKQ